MFACFLSVSSHFSLCAIFLPSVGCEQHCIIMCDRWKINLKHVMGVGARGAGAGERGLKASQALQRPTRAYTPPPVPAEKSSSYPRLHRSAFLFQSADRLAAPPFSGQACCLERASLLHLLARLLAPLPGPARRRGAGGGFAREPAGFPLPLLPPRCLLLLSYVFPTLPLSPLVCV